METPTRTPRTSRTAGRRVTPERMQKILDAAVQIAVEDGFEAVTVQAIATRTGYVRPIVYDCYGTPENIILAALDREIQAAISELNAVFDKVTDTQEISPRDLLDIVIGYGTAMDTRSRTWLLLFLPREGISPPIQAKLASADEMIRLAFGFALSRLNKESDVDIECGSYMALEFLRSASRQMISNPEDYPEERLQRFAAWITAEVQSQP